VRVAIDARPAIFSRKTGIGYYTWHLLRNLPTVDPDTDYLAWYLNARALAGGPGRLLEGVPVRQRWTPIPSWWFERLTERFDLPRVEWFARFDVLFAPNFVPPPTRARRLVVTVHDLAFRRHPETAPQSTRWWLARIDRTLERAARIIAVSEATKRDLIELYGVEAERVAVIPHGVDGEVFHPSTREEVERIRRRYAIDGPYLLSLGGLEPRKNLPNLVRAFARLPEDDRPTLVLAGGSVEWNPEGREALQATLGELPSDVRDGVVLTGYVGEQDKVALLGGAEALVYPSLYEGFGLPVLEAMACGTPVVTSDVSALPEIAGDAALLVDPRDPEAIASAVTRILGDVDLRRDLAERGSSRAAGFTWEKTARSTAGVLHEAAEDRLRG
jgi:glycosyltransferase involved in cell wall biosynthesis